MKEETTHRISTVVANEKQLEITINKLITESVDRADISVQGSPEQVNEEYGVYFIKPEVIQHSPNPPTQEPFLKDDFGWVIGFSFAIPFFICLIVAIFIIGDVRSTADNIIYGMYGAIVGILLGLSFAISVKKNHDKKAKKQEMKGGYVIWVTTHTPEQYEQVSHILKHI